MAQEPTVRVRIIVPNLDALKGVEMDNGCMPIRRRQDGQIELEAYVPQSNLAKLDRRRKRNVTFEVLESPPPAQLAEAEYFSRTNRYADGSLPRGLGVRGT